MKDDDEKAMDLASIIHRLSGPRDRVTVLEPGFLEEALKSSKEEACTHYKVMPKFDEEVWRAESKVFGNDTSETRKRWPRFSGSCPDCGWSGIMYASYLHYIAGDSNALHNVRVVTAKEMSEFLDSGENHQVTDRDAFPVPLPESLPVGSAWKLVGNTWVRA
jgi:hypothetical protein